MSASLDEEAAAYIGKYLSPDSKETEEAKKAALESAVGRLLVRDGFPLTQENLQRAKESFLERIIEATDRLLDPPAKA